MVRGQTAVELSIYFSIGRTGLTYQFSVHYGRSMAALLSSPLISDGCLTLLEIGRS